MAPTQQIYPFASSPLDQALHLICAKMQLTATQRDRARRHYEAVSNYLGRDGGYFERYGLTIYPQGSLRIGTTVKPFGKNEFDLDLVCHLDERSPRWEHNPGELLRLLYLELSANGIYVDKLELMNRCVRLDYAGDFHMDILPGCQDSDRCDFCIEVPDQELRDWSPSNPKGYAQWFEDYAVNLPAILEARGAYTMAVEKAEIEPLPDDSPYSIEPLKRTVQLMKRNRDIFFEGRPTSPTPSIIITTLAAQQYGGLISVVDSILAVLRGIQEETQNHEETQPERRLVVLNPTNEDEEFSERWNDRARYSAFKSWVQNFQTRMTALVASANMFGLARPVEDELSRMFGESFVTPALNELREKKPEYFRYQMKGLGAVAAALGLPQAARKMFRLLPFSGHRQHPEQKWPMAINPKSGVTIQARATTKNKFRGYRNPFNYPSEGISLPKNTDLNFRAKVTNVEAPFEVKWRVVNTGEEAASKNQLRGGFVDGEGPNGAQRTEQTSYRGSHWVDALVIKDGVCVAQSDPFVVNIK